MPKLSKNVVFREDLTRCRPGALANDFFHPLSVDWIRHWIESVRKYFMKGIRIPDLMGRARIHTVVVTKGLDRRGGSRVVTTYHTEISS
jgi:hypothetical protein